MRVLLFLLLVLAVSIDLQAQNPYSKQKFLSSVVRSKNTSVLNSTSLESSVIRNGQFSIGKADGTGLLYGHPEPYSSNTIIRVDDIDYNNSSIVINSRQNLTFFGATITTPPQNSKVSRGVWNVGNTRIEVTQQLSIVAGNDGEESNCEIRYILINRDTRPHSVGLRLLLDTKLGTNDGAPFRVPGVGNVTTDREFVAPNIPPFIEAFDDLARPTIFSIATLSGGNATTPDRVVNTGWGNVARPEWNYQIQAGRDYFNSDINVKAPDSAILLYWNPITLQPGERREIVTYYGSGSAEIDRQPPIATRSAAPRTMLFVNGTATNNPFSASIYLSNSASGVTETARNVQTNLRVSDGLQVASGDTPSRIVGDIPLGQERQVTYSISVAPTASGRKPFPIDISTANNQQKTIIPNIYIFNFTTTPRNEEVITPDVSQISATTQSPLKAETINLNTVEVIDPNGTKMQGTVDYQLSTNTITFRLTGTSKFLVDTRYIARLRSSIQASDGTLIGADVVWTFSVGRTASMPSGNMPGGNVPSMASISGKAMTPSGRGIESITISSNDFSATAVTDNAGNYTLRNIPAGKTYTIQAGSFAFPTFLPASRQITINSPQTAIRNQNFVFLPSSPNRGTRIYLAEKNSNADEASVPAFIELYDAKNDKALLGIPLVRSTGVAYVDVSLEDFDKQWGTSWKNTTDLHILNSSGQPIGKIGFACKRKDLVVGRVREVIVILHNDIVAYQKHPLEKVGQSGENKNWAFANFFRYDFTAPYSTQEGYILSRVGIPITSQLYQTTMLVPPQSSANISYRLSNIRGDKKPVLFIHGVTGTDGYWGTLENDAIVTPIQAALSEGSNFNFGGVKDYAFTSYSGRTQRQGWMQENCDVWEYYYPSDQAWHESGYLLGRDLKILQSFYSQKTGIVAHSMGGLATRSYIEETASNYDLGSSFLNPEQYAEEIDKVLFLGTPHNGSFGATRLYWGIVTGQVICTENVKL
jgi:hypothetical protein